MKIIFYHCFIVTKLKLTYFLSKYRKVLVNRYSNIVPLVILICFISIFNMHSVFAIPQNITGRTHFLTYCDPIYGIKIQYPTTWVLDKKQIVPYDDVKKIVGFIKDPNALAGDFLISVHNLTNKYLSRTIDLETLLNHTVDYYKEYYHHDFNLIESTTGVTLANTSNSAYKLIWTDKDGPYTIKSMQMGTIIGNLAYLIRYYAEQEQYSDNLPLIGGMIDSLTINNNNAADFVSQNISLSQPAKWSC